MQWDVLGDVPSGTRVCFQRQPRITWLIPPKTNDNIIHIQFVLCDNTVAAYLKSKSRYTQ